jgi:hypothetical protein
MGFVLGIKLPRFCYSLGLCCFDSARSLATQGYDCPFARFAFFHDVLFAGRHGGRLAPERRVCAGFAGIHQPPIRPRPGVILLVEAGNNLGTISVPLCSPRHPSALLIPRKSLISRALLP